MKPLELEVLPQKFKHLRELAKTINARQEEILAEKAQLVTIANSLGCNLRLQGLDLIRAKEEIEHGLWLDWLASHCPNVSADTAQVCMRLAKTEDPRHLKDCHTWADCFALLKSESPVIKPEARPWPVAPNLRNLQILQRWSVVIKAAPLAACPPSVLDRYRVLLEPIARMLWPERFA